MNKYKNQKTTVHGYTFDSKKEADRFQELYILLNAGKIEKLALQVPFTLQDGFTSATGTRYRPIKYVADFVYIKDGKWIIEDVKGYRTPVYQLKKKLFAYKYKDEGLEITEI